MGAAAAIAIMRLKERQVVDDFRAAGAVTPSLRNHTLRWASERRGRSSGCMTAAVIREASPGLYYLDEEVWIAVRPTGGVAGSWSLYSRPHLPRSRCGVPQVVKPAVDIQPASLFFAKETPPALLEWLQHYRKEMPYVILKPARIQRTAPA